MKITPHMLVAAVIIVLTLVATLGPISSGIPSYPIKQTEQTVSLESRPQLIPAQIALDPLVPTLSQQRIRNPFNLRAEEQQVSVSVPMPPPPSLTLPEPPAITNPELLR